MSLKWKEISLLAEEARPVLEGSVLQKVAQSQEMAHGESFLFSGFGDAGGWKLWNCVLQDHTAWVFAGEDWAFEAQPEPSTFIMVLRKRLLGQRIVRLEQVANERMLLMHFETGLSLLFELLPRKANLILGEQWNPNTRELRCIHSFRQVSLEHGAIYRLPSPPEKIPEGEIRNFGQEEEPFGFHKAVAEHYWGLVQRSGFSACKSLWRRAWRAQSKKLASALENARADLKEAREAELFQKRGMALVARLYEFGPQAYPVSKRIVLDDIEIPLDPAKTFSENADSCFRKAKKMHRAVGELEVRMSELEKKSVALARLGEVIDKAADEAALEKLTGVFQKSGIPVPEREEESKKESGPKPYLEIESSDGFAIYCGRNQEENRRVTFQAAKGNDLWMHVKGLPGAHVVIKGQRNKTIPLATLLEAAQVCLYHSKIRKGKRAEVDYTPRKHVRAIKGTLAEVTYTGNKTLYVEADPEALKKIMKAT